MTEHGILWYVFGATEALDTITRAGPWTVLSGFQCVPNIIVSLGDSLRISVCSQCYCVSGRFSPDFSVFLVLLRPWEILSGFQCVPSFIVSLGDSLRISVCSQCYCVPGLSLIHI